MKLRTFEGIVFAVVLLTFLLAGGKYFGIMDISSDNTRQVAAFGYNWTITAPFASGKISSACTGQVTDLSSSDKILITAYASGDRCGSTSKFIEVRLDDLNIQEYKRIVIHRKVILMVGAKEGFNEGRSTLFGESTNLFTLRSNAVVNDIYITNDRSSIVVESSEGRFLLDATKPLTFRNRIDFGPRLSVDGTAYDVTYQITGIELTPFSSPVITVTSSDPEPMLTFATDEGIPSLSLWERFKAWVKGVWS